MALNQGTRLWFAKCRQWQGPPIRYSKPNGTQDDVFIDILHSLATKIAGLVWKWKACILSNRRVCFFKALLMELKSQQHWVPSQPLSMIQHGCPWYRKRKKRWFIGFSPNVSNSSWVESGSLMLSKKTAYWIHWQPYLLWNDIDTAQMIAPCLKMTSSAPLDSLRTLCRRWTWINVCQSDLRF